MAGTVYLRTNRFEVKLEGITFKKKHFESLCKIDFLFPDEKAWDGGPPIVGLDVMCHPRDPSIILLLLCFGTGCVILRFNNGESLPAPIHRFLADKRVRLVGFGIPEKMDLFPFEELGLSKNEMDIGYIAAKVFKDPKYKRYELHELARKVLGIKKMIGLTQASSFERHEQIKCAICQLFITSVIAMGLLGANDKKKNDYSSKKSSFLKNFNSLHLLAEGWFKLPKSKKKVEQKGDGDGDLSNNYVIDKSKEDLFARYFVDADMSSGGDDYGDSPFSMECKEIDDIYDEIDRCFPFEGDSKNIETREHDISSLFPMTNNKKPIKGILKCPSTTLHRCNSSETTTPPPSPTTPMAASGGALKRANSKGCNVSFKFH